MGGGDSSRPASGAPEAAGPESGIFQVLSFQNGQTMQARRYQKRRAHRKSKAGCLGCKLKRVKCDEVKPSCGRCRRQNASCNYPKDEDTASDSHTETKSPESSNNSLITTNSPALKPNPSPCLPFDSKSSPSGTPHIFLLHHFQCLFPSLTLLGSSYSPIMSLGLSHPYLLSAMLAVSALHLRQNTPNPSSYRVAEHFQQALTIRTFQTALGQPLNQQTADALLLTSMLLNLLCFGTSNDTDPRTSWVLSRDEDRLHWFSLQMGFKPLLFATQEFHKDTLLKWMRYEDTFDEERISHGQDYKPLDSVPTSWRQLCDLEHDPSPENIFYEPLRELAALKDMPATSKTFFPYMGFFGTLDVEFRALLEKNDARAVWIIGYWFGLLCRYKNIWWMYPRSKRGHTAILMWLRQYQARNMTEEKMQMWTELMHDLDIVTEGPRTTSHVICELS